MPEHQEYRQITAFIKNTSEASLTSVVQLLTLTQNLSKYQSSENIQNYYHLKFYVSFALILNYRKSTYLNYTA